MTTLHEIKAAIDRLSPQEYCELLAMLHPVVADEWDRQMTADTAAGRLDGIIAYRAMNAFHDERIIWIWIGTHAEYDALLR